MLIALTRHGETALNLAGKFQGQSDEGLISSGMKRFEMISDLIHDCPWDAIYCSSYKRAIESAGIIAKKKNIDLHIVPDFCERNLGVLDRKSKRNATSVDPNVLEKLFELNYAPLGGETALETIDRLEKGLKNLKRTDQLVYIVAHAGISSLYAYHKLNVSRDESFLNHGCSHLIEMKLSGEVKLIEANVDPARLPSLIK
jgi:broad specificity phosphatase PhoE